VMLAGGALVLPVRRYPAALRPILELLPTAALGEGLRAGAAGALVGWPLVVMAVWLAVAGWTTGRVFRWTS
jgi:ABC-2 type transport system permease protein